MAKTPKKLVKHMEKALKLDAKVAAKDVADTRVFLEKIAGVTPTEDNVGGVTKIDNVGGALFVYTYNRKIPRYVYAPGTWKKVASW